MFLIHNITACRNKDSL